MSFTNSNLFTFCRGQKLRPRANTDSASVNRWDDTITTLNWLFSSVPSQCMVPSPVLFFGGVGGVGVPPWNVGKKTEGLKVSKVIMLEVSEKEESESLTTSPYTYPGG